jgi:amino-acid N-acetyltransferase
MKHARIDLRDGRPSHARRLHALISASTGEGHLLPRTLADLTAHAERFVVAVRGRQIVGCAELAPLSAHVAEIRSLVVCADVRGEGVGVRLVEELRRRARRAANEKLCAFTHRPGYFARMGFSSVSHASVAEKIVTDCVNCPLFQKCGQSAMLVALDQTDDRPADAGLSVRPA